MLASTADLARLLERVAEGDREAFARTYHATSPKLFGVILRILRDRERSEDILQEVYVRIWERACDFDAGRASPITWMATIARNRAIDEVRRRKPGSPSGLDPEALQVADPGASPVERVEAGEALRELENCLDALDARHRDAVRLAYLDGCSRKELADRFGLPLGTIKTWLHRSLKQLKECLGS